MADWPTHLVVFAQSLKPGTEQVAEPSLMSPWMMGVLVVAIVLVPFGLGSLIAKALKMKDLSMRIGIVLLTLELGLAPFVSQYVIGSIEQKRYQEKLDVWQEHQSYREKISDEGVEKLKSAIPELEVLREEPAPEEVPKVKPK